MKLKIKVIPSSSQDCIAGWLQDTLKVKVKAPPENGKANKAVIKILEKKLGLPKGCIHIIGGATSSRKSIEISHHDETIIYGKLNDFYNHD